MREVGIRELKAHLSECLEAVKAGGTLTITEHKRAIALVYPIPKDAPGLGRLAELAREGVVRWTGRKPDISPPLPAPKKTGSRRGKTKKRPLLSSAVLEDRR